jgi:hypothetical protein
MNADSDLLDIFSRQVSRLKADHQAQLLSASSVALAQFNPMRKATYGLALNVAAQAAVDELKAYTQRLREQVVFMAGQLISPLTDEAIARLLAIADQAFDKDMYPQRLQMLEASMVREGERRSVRVNDWQMRSDIQRAAHHAGTSNMITRALAALADELELTKIQASRKATLSTHQSPIMTQQNTYNISGNSRLYQDSVDKSINIIQADSRLQQSINELRNALMAAGLSTAEEKEAMEVVSELDAALQAGSPKKTVIKALLDALPVVANITTIVTGLRSLLAQ